MKHKNEREHATHPSADNIRPHNTQLYATKLRNNRLINQ
jgi:hypothetical protein